MNVIWTVIVQILTGNYIFVNGDYMAFIRYFIESPWINIKWPNLFPNIKVVYGMINSLSNNKEYCYASNSYFANMLSVKEKTISNSINNLKSLDKS